MNSLIVFATVLVLHGVQSCNHHGSLKYVGEKCSGDSECYSGGSTDAVRCKDDQCACTIGYMAQLQWFTPVERRLVCVPVPYQDQPCTTDCQKPFTCADSRTPGMKTCQCVLPAVMKNGLCYLECNSDEVFDGGVCRKRCAIDENNDRYECKRIGKLGDKCNSKNFCSAPFSQCVDGICQCVNGFTSNANNDACESSVRSCPNGEPLVLKDNKVVECKITKRQSIVGISTSLMPFPRPSQLEDNCGAGQYCMVTSGDTYYADGAVGHCCPVPVLQCPYGLQHPNATCGPPIPDKSGGVDSSIPYCPYGSYTCIRFSVGSGYEQSLCCPIACGPDQLLVDGVCYPRRNYGDSCQVNEQCKAHVGICDKGTCSCSTGYVTEGSIGYRYCRRVCQDNEILIDQDRCLPKLKLGDACDPEAGSQCPMNSFCSADKRVCDCFCGYIEINNEACAPQPTCPDILASRDPSLLDSSFNVTSIALCRVPGRNFTASSVAVDICPQGQYCSDYITEYGLCCPLPDKPFCPNGSPAGEKCNPKDQMPCGPLGFCSRYLNPAGDDQSIDNYVCCSVLQAPMPIANFNQTVAGSNDTIS